MVCPMIETSHIRNFSIIAHIDHGKSTLANRLIQVCYGTSGKFLDSMDIEQERGITIKARTVRLHYRSEHQNLYQLNFIDTPGHSDFSYEVSRSIAACEGSLLVIDATQGVEAQTLANAYQAINIGHTIIPVLNKIELPSADPLRVFTQIKDLLGLDPKMALAVSARNGTGVGKVLEAIVQQSPYPTGSSTSSVKALIIDSWYDPYLGVVVLVRVKDGVLKSGMKVQLETTGETYQVDKVGIFAPVRMATECLSPGEIGFITAGVKRISGTSIGGMLVGENHGCIAFGSSYPQIPKIGPRSPVVFCSFFPLSDDCSVALRENLAKLHLNDPSFSFEPDHTALGVGFRCGFLGLLHLEITRERLEREFKVEIVTTRPSVVYKVHMVDGSIVMLSSPLILPCSNKIAFLEEPWVGATILVPSKYLGRVLELYVEHRGEEVAIQACPSGIQSVSCKLPLSEVIYGFNSRIKSVSRGYASLDFELDGFRKSDLVRLSVAVNGSMLDALASIVHRSRAIDVGKRLCATLKVTIPKQQFMVTIQAMVNNRIVVRESILPTRKNVISKCSGGDVTRKRKLLDRQKKGKKNLMLCSRGNFQLSTKSLLLALNQNHD